MRIGHHLVCQLPNCARADGLHWVNQESGHFLHVCVPQGSVLGPVLFSIYTRDVPSVLHPVPSIQFFCFCFFTKNHTPFDGTKQQGSDETYGMARGSGRHTLYSSQSSVGAVSATLTTAVTNLAVWLQARGLVLNPTKSVCACVCLCVSLRVCLCIIMHSDACYWAFVAMCGVPALLSYILFISNLLCCALLLIFLTSYYFLFGVHEQC